MVEVFLVHTFKQNTTAATPPPRLTIETANNQTFELSPIPFNEGHYNHDTIFKANIDRELLTKPMNIIIPPEETNSVGGFLSIFSSAPSSQKVTITLTPLLDYNFIVDKKICGQYTTPEEAIILLMKYCVLHVGTVNCQQELSSSLDGPLLAWSMMHNLVEQHFNQIHGLGKEIKEEFKNGHQLDSTQLLILSLCEHFKPDENILKEFQVSKIDSKLLQEKHDFIFVKLKDLMTKVWNSNKFTILPLCLYFPNEMKEIFKKKPIVNTFEPINESYRTILTTMKEYLNVSSREFLITILMICPSIFDLIFTIDLFPEIDLSEEEDFIKEIVKRKLTKLKIETIPKILQVILPSSILYQDILIWIKHSITNSMIPQPADIIFNIFVSETIFTKDEVFQFLSKHRVNPNFMNPHFIDHLENLPIEFGSMKNLFNHLSNPDMLLNILIKFNQFTTMKYIDQINDINSLKDLIWKNIMEKSDEYFKFFEEKKYESLLDDFSSRLKIYIGEKNKLEEPLKIFEKLFLLNSKKLLQSRFEFSYSILNTCVLPLLSHYKPSNIEDVSKNPEIWNHLAKLEFKQIENSDLVIQFVSVLRNSYEDYFINGKYTVNQTAKSIQIFNKLLPLYKIYLGSEFKQELMQKFWKEVENTRNGFLIIRKLILETGFHEALNFINTSLDGIPQTNVCDLDKLWFHFLPFKEEVISISCLQESNSFFSFISQETKLGNIHSTGNCEDWIKSIFRVESSFKKKWLEIVVGDATIGTIKQIHANFGDKLEINLIEKYLNCQFNNNSKSNLDFLQKNLNFADDAKKLVRLFQVFNVTGKYRTALEGYIQFNLAEMYLYEFKKQTQDLVEKVTFHNFEVIGALSESREVIDFVVENINEDMRHMINGVEEHSDNFINESTVADLIDVWSFIRPAILSKVKTEIELLQILGKTYSSHPKYCSIHTKLICCSQQIYGLKRLHKNMSNRTELTRETVASLLNGGIASIYSSSSLFHFSISNDNAQYLMDDLNDLRSRCLLLSSNEKRNLNASSIVNYTSFVNVIDNLHIIHQKFTELYLAGYPCPTEKLFLPFNILDSQIRLLEETFETWMGIKKRTRTEFPILNSFHSQQIWDIENCIRKIWEKNSSDESEKKLVNIISLINPTISLPMIREAIANYFKNDLYVDERLEVMGKLLTQLSIKDPTLTVKANGTFIPNGTNVIAVDTKKILPLVLTIFTGCQVVPTPLNTLICYNDTSMDEIDTFLERSKYLKTLHCIVNAHLLPFTVKDFLINNIKNQKECTLVIFTDKKNSIADELKNQIREVKQFDDETLKSFIGTFRPHIEIVISHVSGIGKTEYINSTSFKMKRKPVSFPMSGNLSRKKLVQRLSSTVLKPYSSLHLDISIIMNNQNNLLDFILFEILILGKLSYRYDISVLPKLPIFMEVANTVDNSLINSISFRSLLPITDLNIDFDKRYIVSSEALSPIQVVCQYLYFLQNNLLPTHDLEFEKLKALPKEVCIGLLRKYLSNDRLNSYSSLGVFLKVLANQLIVLSESVYFKVNSLKKMGADPSIRNELVIALITVTSEYSSSISALNKVHALNTDEEIMLKYFNGCLHWEDSNHLLVLFNSMNNQTISAVYRDPSAVPQSISKLIFSQKCFSDIKQLPNFESMNRKELLDILRKICLTIPNDFDDEEYALTPDNILKMILIVTRVKARIPVVILGETGCGKTSLIKYLAKVIKVNLITKDIHAGVTEDDIEQVVMTANSTASPVNPVWLFLDEINTCDSVGLVSEIVCNKSCQGIPLNSNLHVIAACNPYRLKVVKKIVAGLEGKQSESNLAYRVNPLPQSIISYLWDYGTLTENDELRYISTIVSTIKFSFAEATTKALFVSHKFIREHEDRSSVSMRDIIRFKKLYEYFYYSITNREYPCLEGKSEKAKQTLQNYNNQLKEEKKDDRNAQIRAIILGLSHCYYCRLPTGALREGYTSYVCSPLSSAASGINSNVFKKILEEEQKDYILRMELPIGTALNTSLLENVFVVLVCILNKIPIFVVGKPGCSKSLSMQLINSNIRGDHSKDPMFRKLPQILVVAYQGSESSTAEGIEKVFQKAEKYLKNDKSEKVIPVVLLDEVGLAEISKHNPLKVLHRLLEPEQQLVSVVGISNWCLDASKMNRAIHLSRPDSTISDLENTGMSIMECFVDDIREHHIIFIAEIAKAYHSYIENQSHRNFHGLRDYYSLVKYLAKNGFSNIHLKKGLERNFGGLLSNEMLRKIPSLDDIPNTPIIKLIEENISDKSARHLMVITSGDSTLGLLEKAAEVVFGSKFKDDQSEEYNYRVLSRIILCMESGISLILKDLEQIYGSLYDLLNQNYTIVGNKKNCRIALGAYSNPMCHVHDNFKCIIFVDQKNIDFTDPPFLNRFEKQRLIYSDLFTREQKERKDAITNWLENFVIVDGHDFEIKDAVRCYTPELIDSLVVKDFGENNLAKYVADLTPLFNFESILRIPFTNGGMKDKSLSEEMTNFYKNLPNRSLSNYLQYSLEKGLRLNVINTYSSIHTDIISCVGDLQIDQILQVYKLGSFNSEKEFQQKLELFFEDNSKTCLFIQCDAFFDSQHILWLKYKITNFYNSLKCHSKYIFVILHTHRQIFENESWYFNFMENWHNIMIDHLEPLDGFKLDPTLNTISLIQQNIELIYENIIPWCFNCIKYPSNNPQIFQRVQKIQQDLFSHERLLGTFKEIICKRIIAKENIDWRKNVICNKQKMTVNNSAHLAVFDYLCELSREVLGKYIYIIEKYSAFDCILNEYTEDVFDLWKILLDDIDISSLPSPQRDIYDYNGSVENLYFPFSILVNTTLESYHPFFCELVKEDNDTLEKLVEPLRRISFSKNKRIEEAVFTNIKICVQDIIKIQANKFGTQSLIFLIELLLDLDQTSPFKKVQDFEHPMDVVLFMWLNSKHLLSLKEIILTCSSIVDLSEISSLEQLIESISFQFMPKMKLLQSMTLNGWVSSTDKIISQFNGLDLDSLNVPNLTYLKIFNQLLKSCSNYQQTDLKNNFYKLVDECCDNNEPLNEGFMLQLIDEIPLDMDTKSLNQLTGYLVLRSNVDGLYISVIEKQKASPYLLSYFETDILLYMQKMEILEMIENGDILCCKLLTIFNSNMDISLTCDLSTFLCNLFHQNADYILDKSRIDGKLLDNLYNFAINKKNDAILRVLSFALIKNYIDHAISENLEQDNNDNFCTINLTTLIQDFKQDSLEEQIVIYVAKRLFTSNVNTFSDLIVECSKDGHWSSIFPFLSNLKWPSLNKIPNYLLLVDDYSKSLNALNSLIYERDHSQVLEIMNTLFNNPSNTYSMLAVILNHIFVSHAKFKPPTEEIQAVKWLKDFVSKNVHNQFEKSLLMTLLSGKFKNPQCPLNVDDETKSDTIDLVLMIMHIVISFLSYPSCNLGDIIRNPQKAMNMFLPSMPDSTIETIQYTINDNSEPLTRYQCDNCGFMFFVGNCGNISEQSDCPSCKHPIGTKENKKIDNNPQKGSKQFQLYSEYGYLLYNMNNNQPMIFRQNTPHSQLFMSFIVHSLILFQLCTEGSTFINNNGEIITIDYVWNVINNHWSIILSKKSNNLLFHLFLSKMASNSTKIMLTENLYTKQGRLNFEHQFTNSLSKILEKSEENVQYCLKTIENVQANTFSKLELQITEHYKYTDMEKDQLIPNIFKVIELKTFETFYRSFYNEMKNKNNYPLIDYILQNKDKLRLLNYFPNLISCNKYFNQVFDHLLTKEESKILTISDVKEKYFHNSTDSEIFDKHVELFIDCWSNIGMYITSHGCTKLPPITTINEYSCSISVPNIPALFCGDPTLERTYLHNYLVI